MQYFLTSWKVNKFFGVFVLLLIRNQIQESVSIRTYLLWKSSHNSISEATDNQLKHQIKINLKLPTSKFKLLIIENYLKPAYICILYGELMTITCHQFKCKQPTSSIPKKFLLSSERLSLTIAVKKHPIIRELIITDRSLSHSVDSEKK